MSFARFNISGYAKNNLFKSDSKNYEILLIESMFQKGSERATIIVPVVIHHNNYNIPFNKQIKGKYVGVNGYISCYKSPNSNSEFPSISLVVSEMEIVDTKNSEIESIESESEKEDNSLIKESDSDSTLNDDDLPF